VAAEPLTLAIQRLRWTMTNVEAHPLDLPEWKGSMLHGALGWALADVAAAAPAPTWPGLQAGLGLSGMLQDPQQAWSSPLATAPWTLRCASTTRRLHTGERLSGELLLFGPWPDWAVALVVEALQDIGRRGLTVTRRTVRIEVADPESVPVPELPARFTTCTLTTCTPCRLKDRGEDCRGLHPAAIVRSLLRRSRQLHRQLLGGDPDWAGRFEELSRACDALTVLDEDARPVDLDRWSNRQHRHVRMDAVAGTVRFAGEALPLLAPWIAFAPILHIGRQPTFGLGQVEVAWGRRRHYLDRRSETRPQQGPPHEHDPESP